MRQQAATFTAECRKTSGADQGLLAAFLVDRRVRSRRFGRMHTSEVARLLDRSETWVRVHKHFARRGFPCGGGPLACGGDRPECAHRRGDGIFRAILLKALNTFESMRGEAWISC